MTCVMSPAVNDSLKAGTGCTAVKQGASMAATNVILAAMLFGLQAAFRLCGICGKLSHVRIVTDMHVCLFAYVPTVE